MRKGNIPEPMNTTETYLHAMTIRLDALCNMVSSLVEHIASKENMAVEEVKAEVKSSPSRKRSTKGTKE